MSEQTIVRSSCLACGTVDLLPLDVTVFLVVGEDPTYGFQCPRCLSGIRKSTTMAAVALLAGAGSMVVDLPAEATEHHPGEPLTDDDLIRLGRALAGTDLLAEHAGPVTPPGSPAAR